MDPGDDELLVFTCVQVFSSQGNTHAGDQRGDCGQHSGGQQPASGALHVGGSNAAPLDAGGHAATPEHEAIAFQAASAGPPRRAPPTPPGRALKSFGADSQYTGETLNGSRYGRKSFSTGSQYTGELLNGSRHGRGTKRWPNGDMYEGEWYFDKKDGRGNLTEAEASYEGEWRAGMKHGKGTVKFVGGGEYEGEWFSDR